MNMFYYYFGKVIFLLIISCLGIFAVGCISVFLWKNILCYFWYSIKHLFPKWQITEEEYEEYLYTKEHSKPEDWRSKVQINRENRLVIFRSPNYHFFMGNTQFLLIKKVDK